MSHGAFDADTARRFLDAIHGPLQGWLCLAALDRASGRMGQRFLKFPEERDIGHAWVASEATRGFDLYHCAHLLTATERKKAKARPLLSLYADLDGAAVPDGALAPTVTVESSPGHFHCYWRLSGLVQPDTGEALNHRLALAIGADKSGWDLGQLLRLPGTWNHKRETPTPVRLVSADGPTYDAADIDKLLPPLPEKPTAKAKARPKAKPAPATPNANGTEAAANEEPPVRLTGHALERWQGKRPKRDAEGGVDRSRSLYAIACDLARAGTDEDTIAAALADRDEALGWEKYAGRGDAAARYRELAERAVSDVESARRNRLVILVPTTVRRQGVVVLTPKEIRR